ncbi:LysR family transcriptional regulator [Mycobacteroides chelonae]|uniref:Probable hydrogen peroxide-inducible genes activator n=1 Tax=Mycobacteroides chelonae TaxID=1774 RepID=A0A1S1LV10_MYCCH|nr:LysR family transcriptional regulator [Mycobacteroides chelonae]OHU76189.1 LysR family transcriptional regulator [Mycobacteroides chelonae]QQG88576.1 LysR family transcriptional regulator [Mycobacteroides chelonae]QQG93392.1 LysR family transcriptional regulator [Mycobacteroides chelonae]
MELRQLEYFLAVAEHSNFTRAAEALHVAQPWVSAQVRRLERELGHELFDRSSRALKLTEFGKMLFPLAETALQIVGKIRLTASAMAGVLCGHLAIGTLDHPLPLLADALAAFHQAHPAVSITLTEARSDQLTAAVLERKLDVAVVRQGSSTPPLLREQPLAQQNIVAIVHRDDPLASHASISLEDLRNRALISHPQGSGIRAILDQACLAQGFVPDIAFETNSIDMMNHLATRDLGVAVTPEFPADRLDRVRQIDLSDEVMRGRLTLVWREKGATPEAEAFAAYMSELCSAQTNLVGVP